MRCAAWIVVVVALLLAPPALANELDRAKQLGHVGEQIDGYLGVAPGAPPSARSLVERINSERRARYAEIATKNGTEPDTVAALAGKKLVRRAASGEWVRDASGKWTRR